MRGWLLIFVVQGTFFAVGWGLLDGGVRHINVVGGVIFGLGIATMYSRREFGSAVRRIGRAFHKLLGEKGR
jgi:hypothetical protein